MSAQRIIGMRTLGEQAERIADALNAFAEQQRIANMQAERAELLARAEGRTDLRAAELLEQASLLGGKIQKGLGL